jgi:hypothetical protein
VVTGPLRAFRWQLDAGLLGTLYTIHYLPPDLYVKGNRVNGSLTASRAFEPVVDDSAPRSLQPFLQRASTFSVSLGGSGFVTRAPFGGENRTDAALGVGAGLDVYLARFLAVTGGIGYGYDVLADVGLSHQTHKFSASAGIGLRVADTRFDVSYTFVADDIDGTFAKLRWGSVALSVYAVFARQFIVNLRGNVNQEGGTGSADLGLYLEKDLGLFLGGFGGKVHYLDDTYAIRYGGDAGVSYWVAPGARFSAYYQLTVNDMPFQQTTQGVFDYNQVEHGLSLGLLLRF